MKPYKKILVIVCLFLIFSSLSSKEKNKNHSGKWSEYQGEMNWNAAVKKCAEIKMRLPTRSEMETEFKRKNTNSWKKDGYWFWTSEEYSKGDAYYFDIGLGLVVDHLKEEINHVRCIAK
jgi:hypothetical protein